MKKIFVICLALLLGVILASHALAAAGAKVTVICERNYKPLAGAHVWVEEKVKMDGGLVGPDGAMINEFWEPPVGAGIHGNGYTDSNGRIVLQLYKGETYRINVLKMFIEDGKHIILGTTKTIDKLSKDEIIKLVWNKPVKMKNAGIIAPDAAGPAQAAPVQPDTKSLQEKAKISR